jgi:hypothetical protein
MTYTNPELAAEFGLARRQLARIYRDPCHYCKNRVEGWGKAACDTPGRIFPRCLHTAGKQFEPDDEQLQGIAP